jgi:hypothetical protein
MRNRMLCVALLSLALALPACAEMNDPFFFGGSAPHHPQAGVRLRTRARVLRGRAAEPVVYRGAPRPDGPPRGSGLAPRRPLGPA